MCPCRFQIGGGGSQLELGSWKVPYYLPHASKRLARILEEEVATIQALIQGVSHSSSSFGIGTPFNPIGF